MTTRRKKILLAAVLLAVTLLIALPSWRHSRTGPPPLQLALADGRILQIEAVTFGTNHQVGTRSPVLKRFGPWLPSWLRERLTPKLPHAEIRRDKPCLVVWVNALDAASRTNVDCQGVRLEFVDEHGDLFGAETRSWFGGTRFWRDGHVFSVYPRRQSRLRLNVTPWKTNVTSSTEIRNPRVHPLAKWAGAPLPQTNSVVNLQIVLKELRVRTNGGPRKSWETPARFWEPIFEFRHGDAEIVGWDAPEWTAVDPAGNEGKFLGVHQPVLKYAATFYPAATNLETTTIISTLPKVPTASFASNVLWNSTFPFSQTNIFVVGILPAGVNVFSGGVPVANPGITAVRGGAPSGWMSQSRVINPLKIQEWHGHYTPSPALYLRLPKLPADTRIAVRLRDDQGRHWPTKPEPQGQRDDIRPYLIELPLDVSTVTPEVVQLNPVKTEFMVSTPASRLR